MHEAPTKPEIPDYYFDLGVNQDATRTEIKKSYFSLILLHHPDKKAPSESIDAVEFRQVQEAYEVLGDTDEKAMYDIDYYSVQSEWTRYRSKLEDWERHLKRESLRKEAEERARQQAAEEQEQRKATEEAERRRKEEARKWRQATEDPETRRDNFANWASREAERLKQEAIKREEDDRWQQEYEDMVKRREAAKEQEQKAKEQRKKVKEWAQQKQEKKEEEKRRQRRAARDKRREARGYAPRAHGLMCLCIDCAFSYWTEERMEEYEQRLEEAERASEEVAQRAREEMERKAKERLEKQTAAEKKKQEREQKILDRKLAAKTRAADKSTEAAAQKQREDQEKKARLRMAKEHIHKQQQVYLSDIATHSQEVKADEVVIDLGWIKKKGVAKCLFCEEDIKYYSFHCPEGGAVACNPCKSKLSQYTPPSLEVTDIAEGLAKVELEEPSSVSRA